jgi:hypothetical protein
LWGGGCSGSGPCTQLDGIKICSTAFIINTKPLFQRYLDPAIVDASSISGKSLEILVGSWINDLIARGLPDDLPEPQRGLIVASGLINAIQGGYVTQEEFA